MNTPPDKIYLQFYGDPEFWPAPDEPEPAEEVTWCQDKIHDPDIEYLLKDEVVARFEQKIAAAKAYEGRSQEEFIQGLRTAVEILRWIG